MAYKVYDESVLDKKAEFTLSLEIPEASYAVKNPDGSQPVVTLKVEASSNRFALGALAQLHETNEIFSIIAGAVTGKSAEKVSKMVKKNPKGLVAKMTEIHEPFSTTSFKVSDDASGEDLTLAITAPSGMIAIHAFTAITSNQKLSALAATMMPDEDEYENRYWDDEGLGDRS